MQRDEERRSAWHQTTVSWGQLIVACIAIVITVLSAVFLDRTSIEKRVTVLEQEQGHMSERQKAQDNSMLATRSEIIGRLDSLQKQMNEVIVALARHESAASRILGDQQAPPQKR